MFNYYYFQFLFICMGFWGFGVLIYEDNLEQIEGTTVKLTSFPDGHMSHIENKNKLQRVLLEFFKNV